MYTSKELMTIAEEHIILSAGNLMELIMRSNDHGYREQLFAVVQDLMADAFLVAELPEDKTQQLQLVAPDLTKVAIVK